MDPNGCIVCGEPDTPENPLLYECRKGHKMCEECKLHNDQGYADDVELDGITEEEYARFQAFAQDDQHDNEHKLNARQRLMRRYHGDVERLKIKSGTDPTLPDWQRASKFESKGDYDQLKREVEVEKRTLILQGLEAMGIDPEKSTGDEREIALIMEIDSGPCPVCKGKMFEKTQQNPPQAMRLHIAERGPGGAAAAVHVPRQQRRQSEDDAAAAMEASMESLRHDEMRRREAEEADADLQRVLELSRLEVEGEGHPAADPFLNSREADGLRRLIHDYTTEYGTEPTGDIDQLVNALTAFIEFLNIRGGHPQRVDEETKRRLRRELEEYYIPHRARQQQRQPPQLAIFDMGFDPHIVARALDATGGDEDAAIEFLLNQQPPAAAAPRGNAGAAAARGNAGAVVAAPQQPLAAAARGNAGAVVADADDDDADDEFRAARLLSIQPEQPVAAVVQPRQSLMKMFRERQAEAAAAAARGRGSQPANKPSAPPPTRKRGGYKMSRKSKLSKKSRKSKLSKMSRKSKLSKMYRKSKMSRKK